MTRLFFNEYFERKQERLTERQDEKLFTLEKTDVNNFEFISVSEHLEIIKKRDAEIVKLKEELENFAYDIQESNIENCDECCNGELLALARKELAKRDQLLEQAKPWIENHKRFLGEGFFFNEEFDEWLKQAGELKGGK